MSQTTEIVLGQSQAEAIEQITQGLTPYAINGIFPSHLLVEVAGEVEGQWIPVAQTATIGYTAQLVEAYAWRYGKARVLSIPSCEELLVAEV